MDRSQRQHHGDRARCWSEDVSWWLTGAPSVPEVSSIITGGSPSPVGVPGALGTPGAPAFHSMSRDTATGGFPGILEFPNGVAEASEAARERAVPWSHHFGQVRAPRPGPRSPAAR